MALVRHPHRGELARAQQLGEAYRITPVRLYSIAGLLRNERGGHHQALIAEALEQSVETISCRPCFIAKISDDSVSLQALPPAFGSLPPWKGTPRETAPRRHGRHRQ